MTPSERRPPGELRERIKAGLETAATLCAEAVEHARIAAALCDTAAELREQASADDAHAGSMTARGSPTNETSHAETKPRRWTPRLSKS